MRLRKMLLLGALVCGTAGLAGADPAAEPPELLFGGCGGVYLLAEPGELRIEVFKRDRNRRGRHTELRAILVGPDREVLKETVIPDDGQDKGEGPLGSATIKTTVERKGVHALNITVSQDRYGEEAAWGFRTNCPRYLIETARGHRDERHREPIVLMGGENPARICFLPRRGEFEIAVSGLSKKEGTLRLVDANEKPVLEWRAKDGEAVARVGEEPRRDAVPWRLDLPSSRATVTIDGLTQWDAGDPCPDVCVWTPDPSSWFPLLEHRWLLTPYRQAVHAQPGAEGRAMFRVHNNAALEKKVRLGLEFPDASWAARVEEDLVTVGPGKAKEIALRFVAPPGGGTVHVRATPEDAVDFTTYSTLSIRAGDPPPLEIPLQLLPYRHENELFGYQPGYPVESQPYFDLENRPFVVTGGQLATVRDGSWVISPLPGSSLTSKVAFDAENGVYLIALVGGKASLLHSTDSGRTFAAYEIPGPSGSFDIEQFSGHNLPDGPPPFVRIRRTASDPKLKFRSLNDLDLFVPRFVDGRIEIGDPIPITRACIGLASHSGVPSSLVSRGARVHVAWGEATDPEQETPGVPTYVVTWDGDSKKLGEPVLIGYGPPANDGHNSPSITMDSQGFLHVLIGTHGRPFPYVRSKQPNDAGGGWTEPEPAGEDLSQTYIGFVCGPDDTLYSVFRLWRSGEPFPHSTHATLACQRKRPGGRWEEPRILVRSAFSEYSIFYHRLTIDRMGRLFLSKDYWSTHWFYRNDQPGRRDHWRSLLLSPDGAETWKLAVDGDFKK